MVLVLFHNQNIIIATTQCEVCRDLFSNISYFVSNMMQGRKENVFRSGLAFNCLSMKLD